MYPPSSPSPGTPGEGWGEGFVLYLGPPIQQCELIVNLDVALLPNDLSQFNLSDRTVVVFDVLRATTTMTAALAVGVREIRIFGGIDAALSAAEQFGPNRLLCGEQNCLPPPGFDLGNSPGAFNATHAGRTLFMSTTNGTRAILAAKDAAQLLAGSLVNASAVAHQAMRTGRDTLLLCAGTNGQVAMEDLVGCGAVLSAMEQLGPVHPTTDTARIARRLFQSARADLLAALRQSQGGQNVLAAGLSADIDFAARLDAIRVVGRAQEDNGQMKIRTINPAG